MCLADVSSSTAVLAATARAPLDADSASFSSLSTEGLWRCAADALCRMKAEPALTEEEERRASSAASSSSPPPSERCGVIATASPHGIILRNAKREQSAGV